MPNPVMLSVIVPLYNKEQYIERSLKTALSQDFHNFEVIVVDDGSSDRGVDVVREKFGHDQRIRVVQQANGGQGSARNHGVRVMRGSIAVFLDADDEWLPTHLTEIAELSIRFPEAGWFATGFRSVFARGLTIKTALRLSRPVLVSDYFKLSTGSYPVHASSFAIRKSAFAMTDGFLVTDRIGEDLEFYARVALQFPLAYGPSVSALYHCFVPGSALATSCWTRSYPPVVRTLDSYENDLLPSHLRKSVRRYADWVMSSHILAGLCSGHGEDAMKLLEGRPYSTPPMLLVARLLPPRILHVLLRLVQRVGQASWTSVFRSSLVRTERHRASTFATAR